MKRLVLLIALFSIPIISFSQIQITAGPEASYNNTWLINPNMFIVSNQDPLPTFTWGSGFSTDIKLTKWLGFHTGYLSNEIKQDFTISDENDNEFSSNHSLKTSNIPLILRFGGPFYFETGFQHTQVRSARLNVNGVETDVANTFRDNNWLVTGGFGGNIGIAPRFKLNIGFRTAYAMNDFKGVDAWGRDYEEMTYFSELVNDGIDISEIEGADEYIDQYNEISELIQDFDNLAKTYALSVSAYVGLKFCITGCQQIKKD